MIWRFLEARAGLFWLIFNPISRNWVTLPRNNQPRHRWGPTDQSQGSVQYSPPDFIYLKGLCLKTAKAAVTPNLMREGDTKYFHVKRLKYFHGKGGESRCGVDGGAWQDDYRGCHWHLSPHCACATILRRQENRTEPANKQGRKSVKTQGSKGLTSTLLTWFI